MTDGTRLPVATEADLVVAILAVKRHAESLLFESSDVSRLTTATSELTRNVLKYARGGYVLLRTVEKRSARGLEIEVGDRGPGIENVEAALREHVSTGGTLGLGLPGVRRLMDEFTIASSPAGTLVTVRKWS